MNDTKWIEIFKAFYYEVECSEDSRLSKLRIPWATKTTGGFLYSDCTWTHFGVGMEHSKEIEWLKIDLSPENRSVVLDILRRIYVPGEVLDDCVFVYGYRTDVDYIK